MLSLNWKLPIISPQKATFEDLLHKHEKFWMLSTNWTLPGCYLQTGTLLDILHKRNLPGWYKNVCQKQEGMF